MRYNLRRTSAVQKWYNDGLHCFYQNRKVCKIRDRCFSKILIAQKIGFIFLFFTNKIYPLYCTHQLRTKEQMRMQLNPCRWKCILSQKFVCRDIINASIKWKSIWKKSDWMICQLIKTSNDKYSEAIKLIQIYICLCSNILFVFLLYMM